MVQIILVFVYDRLYIPYWYEYIHSPYNWGWREYGATLAKDPFYYYYDYYYLYNEWHLLKHLFG